MSRPIKYVALVAATLAIDWFLHTAIGASIGLIAGVSALLITAIMMGLAFHVFGE